MAGLLAWAADVVGGGGQSSGTEEIVFSPEQLNYVRELDRRAASLQHSIQDLRLRIPPQDISLSLPHLHAHSLASNAALTLQRNAHFSTRHQAQLREEALQEENAAYEKVISDCQKKIREKFQEAERLQCELEEMELTEKSLRADLEKAEASLDVDQATDFVHDSETIIETQMGREPPKHVILEELEYKKKELSSVEELVQNLENTWSQVQNQSAKQPSPAQREMILEKQLQSLIEQLETKQLQAKNLVTEIRGKEQELEKQNGLWRRIESGNAEANTARNRFGKSNSSLGSSSSDYIVGSTKTPAGVRSESQQKMILRSAFVLYILALHVVVFIKISY